MNKAEESRLGTTESWDGCTICSVPEPGLVLPWGWEPNPWLEREGRQEDSLGSGLDDLGYWWWQMKVFSSQLQLSCSEVGTALLTLLVKHLESQLSTSALRL